MPRDTASDGDATSADYSKEYQGLEQDIQQIGLIIRPLDNSTQQVSAAVNELSSSNQEISETVKELLDYNEREVKAAQDSGEAVGDITDILGQIMEGSLAVADDLGQGVTASEKVEIGRAHV